MKKAWIIRGGWDGHEPVATSERFARMLRAHDFEVTIFDTQEPLEDLEKLKELDLIVFAWTMGTIDHKYVQNVSEAVQGGVGLTGCHGSSPITEGICDFPVASEQYYMHVDPANEVLATTRFPVVPGPHDANKPVDMPVAWTRLWGKGRVFYSSLGHHDDVFDNSPEAAVLMERGMLWAARAL